jgi:hypothetical protein
VFIEIIKKDYDEKMMMKIIKRNLIYNTDFSNARNFSSSPVSFFSPKDKIMLNKLYKEEKFESLPILNQAKAIENEGFKSIAAAYKDDLEGLKRRLEDSRQSFRSLNEPCEVQFTKRNELVLNKFLDQKGYTGDVRSKEYKEVITYMENLKIEKDRVGINHINDDNIRNDYGYLTKSIFTLFRKSELQHLAAIRFLEKKKPSSINPNEIKDIDKDLFKKGLSLTYQEDKNIAIAESSLEGSKRKRDEDDPEQSSSKKPFEPEKVNKSAIDFVIEKQQTEMPDLQDSTGDS